MAFLHYYVIFLYSLSHFYLTSTSQPRPRPDLNPTSLVVAVRQDLETGFPIATLVKRTPPVPLRLLLHINGRFVALNCDAGPPYFSATYDAPPCNSAQCSRVSPGPNRVCQTCRGGRPRPGCHNGTCAVSVSNPVTRRSAVGELGVDSLTLRSVSPRGPPSLFSVVRRFLFVCAPPELFYPGGGFPRDAVGVAGLGNFHESLPSQVTAQFGLGLRFSVCLPRGGGNTGAVFVGEGPAEFRGLIFTPLSVSHEGEYFISVRPRGIRINRKVVETYVTRAIISTTARYSILEHTMYAAVTRFFSNQISRRVPRVGPVGPLGVCFNLTAAGRISVPLIELVVPGVDGGGDQRFVISPANSVVEARPGVLCLAFVDGGRGLRRGQLVIGAYQLEENLIRLDLVRSVFGFSNSLLAQRTSCSHLANFAT